jgi:AcrR family transcriptional regulator
MGRRPRVTREEVFETARQVFVERGFEGATLTAIAARLGLSPAALLRHAPTKQELFSAAMSAGAKDLRIPMDALAEVPDGADPREVLRALALAFVPFIEARIGESIVSFMRENAAPSVTIRLFPKGAAPSPPQRALALLTSYFRRSVKAGRMETEDPQAAALAFLASLHAYVFLHRFVKIADPPIALPRYVDALLDVWTKGALRPRATRPRRKKTA